MAVRLPRRLLFPSATWEPDAFAMREPCNLRISVFFCRAGSLTRHGVDHRLTPRSQVVLGNALGGARTAVRLPRYLPFPSATWERGALLKLVRCRRSLAATLAALPSMSLRPLASIRNSDFEIRNFPRPAL